MTNVLTRWHARRRADREYFAADAEVARCLKGLARNDCYDRAERVRCLREMTDHLVVVAETYSKTSCACSAHEGEVSATTRRLWSEVLLVRWLAGAENGVVPVGPAHPAFQVLSELADDDDRLSVRARLVLGFAEVMGPVVGVQATEVLLSISRAYVPWVEDSRLPEPGTEVWVEEDWPDEGDAWHVALADHSAGYGFVIACGFRDRAHAREWAVGRQYVVTKDEECVG